MLLSHFILLNLYRCISFNRFVKGIKPGRQSGFDIDEADLTELEQPHEVIVASAIFGTANTRHLQNYEAILGLYM